MRSEISELRDENYTLKKRIKELESQLDHKTSKVWYCQICMEEDQATGVDDFGNNCGSRWAASVCNVNCIYAHFYLADDGNLIQWNRPLTFGLL